MSIEKQASDPLQILGTQKEPMQPKIVSFDEENLRYNLQCVRESESKIFRLVSPSSDEEESAMEDKEKPNGDISEDDSKSEEEDAQVVGDGNREDEDEINCIKTPKQTDILSGRGAGVNLHPGNVYFRDLIAEHKHEYLASDPGEKKRIIRRIVQAALSRGRFMKQDPQSELWICITFDEARKKVGQALRENAPAIKKQGESKETIKKRKFIADVHSEYLNPASTSPSFMPQMELEMLSSKNRPFMNPSIKHHNLQSQLLSQPQQRANYDDTVDGFLWRRLYMIQQEQDLLNRQLEKKNDEIREVMDALYRCQMGRLSNSPRSPIEMLLQQQQQPFALSANDNVISDRKLDSNDVYTTLQKKRRITIGPGA